MKYFFNIQAPLTGGKQIGAVNKTGNDFITIQTTRINT